MCINKHSGKHFSTNTEANIHSFPYLHYWIYSQSAPRKMNAAPGLATLQIAASRLSCSIVPRFFSFLGCISYILGTLYERLWKSSTNNLESHSTEEPANTELKIGRSLLYTVNVYKLWLHQLQFSG